MRIDFCNLIIEGFGSIGKAVSLDLSSGGVNVVRGKNGAGKTTVFSALCWALFKTNLKGVQASKITTFKHLQPEGYRGTRVCVEVMIGDTSYIFARHKDFKGETLKKSIKNGLVIFKDGDLVNTGQLHSGDYDEEVVRLLGIDKKVFLNSLLFGQGLERLSRASNEDKRNLFDLLFDAAFVAKAKEAGKLEQSRLTGELSALGNTKESTASKLSSKKSDIASKEEMIEGFELDKKERLDAIQSKIGTLIKSKKMNEGMLLKFDGVPETLSEGANKLDSLEGKLATKKLELETLREGEAKANRDLNENSRELEKCRNARIQYENDLKEVETTCSVCGNPLDEKGVKLAKKNIKAMIDKEKNLYPVLEDKLEKSKKILNEKNTLFSTCSLDVDAIKAQITPLRENRSELEKNIGERSSIREAIKSTNNRLDELRDDYSKEEAKECPDFDVDGLKTECKALEEDLLEIESKVSEKSSELAHVDWWVSTGFGASGVKAYIFKSMLHSLNESVANFGDRLGVGINFSVDVSGTRSKFEILCSIGGHVVDYLDLSGGEKQRVDVCLSFAVHSIVNSTIPINILVLDEVFEGLDEEGIETVFELIRMKAEEGKTVFVVTHNSSIDSMYTKNIEFDKVNGITALR